MEVAHNDDLVEADAGGVVIHLKDPAGHPEACAKGGVGLPGEKLEELLWKERAWRGGRGGRGE